MNTHFSILYLSLTPLLPKGDAGNEWAKIFWQIAILPKIEVGVRVVIWQKWCLEAREWPPPISCATYLRRLTDSSMNNAQPTTRKNICSAKTHVKFQPPAVPVFGQYDSQSHQSRYWITRAFWLSIIIVLYMYIAINITDWLNLKEPLLS